MTEENPFVAEEHNQFCWRDASRACGPECVAYDARCQQDAGWNPCLLINIKRSQAVSAHQTTQFLSGVAKGIIAFIDSNKGAQEANSLSQKLKEMDRPPPEIKV